MAEAATQGSQSEDAHPTEGELQKEIALTKIYLLKEIRKSDNYYKTVAAAQSFALIQGSLSSTTSVQMRSN